MPRVHHRTADRLAAARRRPACSGFAFKVFPSRNRASLVSAEPPSPVRARRLRSVAARPRARGPRRRRSSKNARPRRRACRVRTMPRSDGGPPRFNARRAHASSAPSARSASDSVRPSSASGRPRWPEHQQPAARSSEATSCEQPGPRWRPSPDRAGRADADATSTSSGSWGRPASADRIAAASADFSGRSPRRARAAGRTPNARAPARATRALRLRSNGIGIAEADAFDTERVEARRPRESAACRLAELLDLGSAISRRGPSPRVEQPPQDRGGASPNLVAERRAFHRVEQLRRTAPLGRQVAGTGARERPQTSPADLRRHALNSPAQDRGHRVGDLVARCPGVEQGGQEHVARGAATTST